MVDVERDLDSRTYRKLLEFIKKEGVDPVSKFWVDFVAIRDRKLIYDALCDGRHPSLSFVMKHKAVTGFIKTLDTHNYPCFLLESNFPKLLEKLSAENISKQIEGARCLEELGVHSVNIKADISKPLAYHTYIHWADGRIMQIIKYYSNGEVVYRRDEQHSHDDWEKYYTDISFSADSGNFVIDFDTVGNNLGCKTATVTDFDFDTSLLPSEEELSRMDVPKSLADSKVYVKRK